MELFYGKNILLLWLLLLLFGVQFAWIYMPAEEKWNRKLPANMTDFIFCLCLALAIGTLLRQYPWTNLPTQTDSSVFLYIGRQMHRGKVPYVDLFDHKGPLLYFIQYLGCSVWPNSVAGGVWILEVLSFGVLIRLMLKLSEFSADDRRDSYLGCILLMIVCSFKLYQGGNYTEEYALPWMTLACIIFCSFFRTGNYTRWQIVVLGLSCMVVFLMQENLITVWIAYIPLVLILLAREKRYKEIGSCIFWFLVGMMIVLVPVLIWAVYNHCLSELWKYYIVFNFEYSGSAGPTAMDYLLLTKKTLSRIWPAVAAMIISLICNSKDKIQWMNLWLFIVSLILVEISGRDSLYYLLTLLPALVIPASGLFAAVRKLYGKRGKQNGNRAVIILTCLVLVAGAVGHRALSNRKERYEDGVVPYLTENTTEEDDVLIIGNYAWPYLAADRSTENRFFFQWPPIWVSDEIYAEFLHDLETHPSDVVILAEHENGLLLIPGEGKIDDTLSLLLDRGYRKEQYEGFSVYLSPDRTDVLGKAGS